MDYQKQDLQLAHVFWSDFDSQIDPTVEEVVNFGHPKDCPFSELQGMGSDFQQLIDSSPLHPHVK
jgi:hypothetical protein